jgi:H+/Cl- antiporter ClcA
MSPHSTDRRRRPSLEELGDFTTTVQVIPISLIAIVIGVISTYVAWLLLKLIGLITNLAYYHRFDASFASPAGNQLGVYAIAVPVVGSLIVGFMARYGSERIRGHGIPEAIESILMNGSRVRPRLAILKPLSAAISIGTGGPFGAEGPIIMTGGGLRIDDQPVFSLHKCGASHLAGGRRVRRYVGHIRGAAFRGVDRRRAFVI